LLVDWKKTIRVLAKTYFRSFALQWFEDSRVRE